MEIVSVKFQEDVLKKVDDTIAKHNFNSRTEFIREAVRDKLANLSRDELINEFMKFKGKSSKKTSFEDDDMKTRELFSKELMGELDKRFSH
jgi:Arc/MetJ-type ribon-helix-helix transcriptional regulator